MTSLLALFVLVCLLVGTHKAGVTASNGDSILGGVCGGIARQAKMEPNLVRVLAVLAGLLSGGFVVLLYICLWISLPRR
ncbi:MAG: PspC domain-containing protein [Cyanobacteria bacterium SZAS LIN-2]|nr:PspC domain-containing protein [Cyanobacteria bacterium SZAS LIN-3]MBS1997134.1 PspC domain-containing protein [Cyanobacteria bacterium SZAS LIN-2]MBS2007370.1 PspC domain-containing protein [Cyanobacteria bacterium SZAS TMP-1]